MKKFNRVFTVLIFIFLYVPMAVLIVASFDTGKNVWRASRALLCSSMCGFSRIGRC